MHHLRHIAIPAAILLVFLVFPGYSGAQEGTPDQVEQHLAEAEAALQEPVLSKAFTRFRIPWQWNGGPAVLQSRAWDTAGHVQPTRAEILAWRGRNPDVPPVTGYPSHHYNGPTSWAIAADGGVSHVYV